MGLDEDYFIAPPDGGTPSAASGSGTGGSGGKGSGGNGAGGIEAGGGGGSAGVGGAAGGSAGASPGQTWTMSHFEDYMLKTGNGIDQCTSTAAGVYCAGSCRDPCDVSNPSAPYAVTTGISSPQYDGSSTRVDVAGPGTTTNEWVKFGKDATQNAGPYMYADHFQWGLQFYPTTKTNVPAYDFYVFFGGNGYKVVMGLRCILGTGTWQGWDEVADAWTDLSSANCAASFNSNTWNHVVLRMHRDPGVANAATQCYYDGVEVNGATVSWTLPGHFAQYTGGPGVGWGDIVGTQVRQELASSFGGTVSFYYDAFEFRMTAP